jgi:hypothetical protein
MKVVSKLERSFYIELDENHYISYNLLYEFFYNHDLSEMISRDQCYIDISDTLSKIVCDEMLAYYIDKKMIGEFSYIRAAYKILDEKIIKELYKLEKLFRDLEDNYVAYKREHTIDSIIN